MSTLGPLMLDIAGLELSSDDRAVLAHPLVGGVILFARNYSDPTQLRQLCAGIAAIKQPRLLLAVDHEGGRVQRFRSGFTLIPPMGTLGRLYAGAPVQAEQQARDLGATIGRELGSFGIDLCFAPVLDRDTGNSQIIGDRAFAGEADTIVHLARAFCAGLNAAGMAATGKHFPGHGAVAADSHTELPVDNRTAAQIEAADLKPFQALITDGIQSLMMAHVLYPEYDTLPASLSRRWIGEVLRGRLQYDGAVFCDDLSMEGARAAGSVAQCARLALDAGCDMLPVCNDRQTAVELLDALSPKPRRISDARLQRLYRREVAR